jgi:DNA-binding transcriptional ArsR family regulator
MTLEDIIISRVRVKILELFLLHPKTMLHVRDIVRKVDEEINAVRRELSHMEKAGMVSKEQRANRLFYIFRKDYPLYEDLLRLINKSAGLGGDMLKNKPKLGKVKFALIAGRFIKGLPKKSPTDVDVLLVGTVVLPELASLIKAEEARREAEVNYTVMTEEEFAFRKSRRDPFVVSILSASRLMIIGDEEELIRG